MAKVALITGIRGQDGFYLADSLLAQGVNVHGVTRTPATQPGNEALDKRIHLHFVSDREEPYQGIEMLIEYLCPDEIYHLAADSFVPSSWEKPAANLQINAGLTARILEAVRRYSPYTRIVNACSREIFGTCCDSQANESTSMSPVTPYGISKAASRWLTHAYRERYGLFATNAILFNHESPRRPEKFVTRKISAGVAKIALNLSNSIQLGNMSAMRDWGFAGDYVDAMIRMLQLDRPEDFVLGTGAVHSISDFASIAFQYVGLDWRKYVQWNPQLARPGDAASLAADSSKARQLLGWVPRVSFQQLVEMMVEADLNAQRESTFKVAA
ncbi:MAG: GDP-mannose 4,6-dehydratase [bacterium]|nr:GDP-mannose 4,6-dehydratase [bacterium]